MALVASGFGRGDNAGRSRLLLHANEANDRAGDGRREMALLRGISFYLEDDLRKAAALKDRLSRRRQSARLPPTPWQR